MDDEKIKEIVMESIKTAKESIAFQTSDHKDKENRLWRMLILKLFILFCLSVVLITGLFIADDLYKTHEQYNYTGYPESQIQNTNVGGDYNDNTKATTATKATTPDK